MESAEIQELSSSQQRRLNAVRYAYHNLMQRVQTALQVQVDNNQSIRMLRDEALRLLTTVISVSVDS